MSIKVKSENQTLNWILQDKYVNVKSADTSGDRDLSRDEVEVTTTEPDHTEIKTHSFREGITLSID